jgi:hypothetical protein
MSEPLGRRADAGKPAMDLIPWSEIHITDRRVSVAEMSQALQTWWCAAPVALESSIPRSELFGIASVLEFGARKYEPRNWELGLPFSKCFAPAQRHALRLDLGELLDPESGLPHQSHFWCNVLFLVTFTRRQRASLDDRPPADPVLAKKFEELQAMLGGLELNNTLGAKNPKGVS